MGQRSGIPTEQQTCLEHTATAATDHIKANDFALAFYNLVGRKRAITGAVHEKFIVACCWLSAEGALCMGLCRGYHACLNAQTCQCRNPYFTKPAIRLNQI